jgi:hypothetical protein
MEKHISVLGILYIVIGTFRLLVAGTIFVILAGGALLSGEPRAAAIVGLIATTIASFLAILAIPDIIGGIFLLRKQPWSRIFVLVLGFLNLLDIPFGTALGIYTIWVLMKDETIKMFSPNKVAMAASR